MGGIHLTSPDFETGFPITAAQLHYLVLHGHVEFPDLQAMNIDERSTADILSRMLTVWQALWFSVTELQRWRNGLPLTTLELTALSFVLIMLFTELLWLRKPSLMKPRNIPTKDDRTVQDIRRFAKEHTHPDLQPDWHCTPLMFIEHSNIFHFNNHWCYYSYLARAIRVSPTRKIKSKLWDRIPSDTWLPIERSLLVPSTLMTVAFSLVFLPAWNFFFPSEVERRLWRVVSSYHAAFSLIGGAYYFVTVVQWHRVGKAQAKNTPNSTISTQPGEAPQPANASYPESVRGDGHGHEKDPESLEAKKGHGRWKFSRAFPGLSSRIARRAVIWRNPSPDGDPNLAMRLRLAIPFGITSGLYILCRMYVYVEDFNSLREQPIGVFITVNRFIPFMGS
jgi:hypothetical protein